MAFKSSEAPRKMELVSLIDVVFLLLIFFIVTTSVLTKRLGEEKIEASETVVVPDANAPCTVIDLWIRINQNNEFEIVDSFTPGICDQHAQSIEPITVRMDRLRSHIRCTQSGKVVISAEDGVLMQRVVQIASMCKEKGNSIIFSDGSLPSVDNHPQFRTMVK